MRMLFLVPDLFGPGGIARYCRLVVKAIDESDGEHALDVLALNDPVRAQPDAVYIRSASTRYRSFGGNRRAFSSAALLAMRRLRYDAILVGHVNFGLLSYLGSMGVRPPRRITLIYGIDAWDALPWHRRLPLAQSNRVFAISRFTAGLAERSNRLSERRIRILHNCLDPALESPGGAVQAAAPSGRILLTVSRLSRSESSKGHDVVLQALPTILNRHPDVEYHVVGEGDLREDLEQMARNLNVAENVVFHGRVSDGELREHYAKARVFVMPSRKEGFGFVFLEALEHEVPVVAGCLDAAPEVLGDDEGGVLVDPLDPAAVAAAVCELLDDDDLRQRRGRVGRARVDRMFRFPKFRESLMTYLDEVGRDGG